jgi:NADPH:quinone reductase-like Zn-dependent oxidoreductase
MKAVVMREFGGPEVLRYEEIETPKVGADDVLVEVRAVSVNRTLDLVVREKKYVRVPALPHILGVDPSGVIAAVGAKVVDRRIGDRVYVSLFVATNDPAAQSLPGVAGARFLGVDVWGGYAQYVRVPAVNTIRIPDDLSFREATVIGRHLATAVNQVEGVGRVKAGDWVLVMGASGGLGSAAVQVARWNGAHVIAAAGTDERVRAAVAVGAQHGVNYRAQDLVQEVMRITGGRGVDLVCENVADPELFRRALYAMTRGGRMVTAGNASGHIEVPLDIRRLYLLQLQIIGEPREQPGGLEAAFARAGLGQVRTIVDRVFPLSRAAEAHRRVAERVGVGKVLLDPTLD